MRSRPTGTPDTETSSRLGRSRPEPALANSRLIPLALLLLLVQATRMAFVEIQWRPFYVEAYVFTGAIFFALCFTFSRLSQRVERHLGRGSR